MRPDFSIRARLLVLLLAAIAALWSITAVWSYSDALHEMDEVFDAQLAESARLLLVQAGHELGEEGVGEETISLEDVLHHPYEQKLYCQVWSADGRLLYRSSSRTPATPLSRVSAGFSDSRIDHELWRVFAVWGADRRLQIQIGQMYEVRQELAGAVARHIVYPMLFALPLFGLLVWFAVGLGIAPLRWVAREVSRRAPEHLAPLEVARTPREVQPIVHALNALLERLGRALALERQFTADAAHELRTPLAGLRTQAQVAARARDDGERQRALGQVLEGVDRMTHLVQQLLTLARLEPDAPLEHEGEVGLRAVAGGVLAELAPAAVEHGIDLSLAEGPPVAVSGRAELLRVLIRNLVDNAIRYTPAGGTVQVEIAAEGPRARITVLDSGPGIPEAERARVFDRFYRVLGSGGSGSGLGLAIVRRIADLHGAEVRLEAGEAGHGLRVVVELPRWLERTVLVH
jgi:two-component system sensor histidine kinase QseC